MGHNMVDNWIMSECLICDFPEAENVQELLDRIDDEAMLVALACDMAEHTLDLIDDPAASSIWLEVARGWKLSNEATLKAIEANSAQAAKVTLEVKPPSDRSRLAPGAVAWACRTALWASRAARTTPVGMNFPVKAAQQTAESAAWARGSGNGYDDETAWQLSCIQKLVCHCDCPAAEASYLRSRNSLLAS